MHVLATKPPRHYNPHPRFGLRVPTCRGCGIDLEPHDNRVVDLGAGVFAKFGLCKMCLWQEMDERERDAESLSDMVA